MVEQLDEKLLPSIFLTSTNLQQNALEVAWTLSHELRFYLVFYVFFFLTQRPVSMRTLSLFAGVFVLYNLYQYAMRFDATVGGVWPLRGWLNAFYLEFIFGIAIYLWHKQHRFSLSHFGLLPWLSCLLMAAGAFNPYFANFELLRVATYGVASALLLVYFLALQDSEMRAPQWFTKIGDASHSLYLLHPLLLHLIFVALFKLQISTRTLPIALAATLLITVLCYLWYLAVERPTLRMLQVAYARVRR